MSGEVQGDERKRTTDEVFSRESKEDGRGNRTDYDAGGEQSSLDSALASHVQETGRKPRHLGAIRERGSKEQFTPGGHEGEDNGHWLTGWVCQTGPEVLLKSFKIAF